MGTEQDAQGAGGEFPDISNQHWHVDPLDPPPDDTAEALTAEGPQRQTRVAKSILRLLGQLDAAYPDRRRKSDGTIGDKAHQSRASDHNPWIVDDGLGVVTAVDVTHDPATCDAGKLVEALRASRDPRIKYLIWNRRIANHAPIGAWPAWAWRTYSGPSPHDHHCHLSVRSEKHLYDDNRDWALPRHEERPEGASGVARSAPDDAIATIRESLEALSEGGTDDPIRFLADVRDELDALVPLIRDPSPSSAPLDSTEGAATSFAALRANYEALWAGCRVRTEKRSEVAWYRAKLLAGRARYEAVAAAVEAPWWFIGIVHGLEGSFSFSSHLHNGDPLTAQTVQVPAGRPKVWLPPSDWESSAVDAITMDRHAHQKDWSVARSLHRFEGFNGYGYYARGINSPYLWSFSNHYEKGKFVRDGKYDPNAVSRQCGAAVMLKALAADGLISFGSP
ncbi:hypothetical protein [Sphingomonas sp. IC4-52]|uniref:hypothetical protein n=1 Tax=Sphingomonas sp. IC4-52 TaxID=2887202 RepID=UPI001D12D3AD|nr:hypothetical protein [Sphingomonas sp. IC4-52]MCC2981222.1 hypothetical protein [Sphingomonas sp. IC4-52]